MVNSADNLASDTGRRGGVAYLAKNIGLLTVSNFATKILVFFLVPLYTSVLTTDEYGTYDLFNTTINLLIPVLTANMAESVLRFALDDGIDKADVFGVGMRYTCMSIVLMCVVVTGLAIVDVKSVILEWWPLFLALYASQSLLTLISSFTRGLEKVREIAIGGVLASLANIVLNLIFLLPLRMGLMGYFLASIAGSIIHMVYLVVSTQMWQFAIAIHGNNGLAKKMRTYGVPMMANSVAWWVNNVSDRYVVIAMRGLAESGVYAVGTKIPSILNMFQSIFNQAWVLSAVRDIDAEDSDGFFRKTYNAYGCLMVLVCSALIVLDRPLARFLYVADFYSAWRYVPFLMISMVFGALSGHLGGIYAAAKDSKLYARSSIVGAVINIVANLVTVPFFGAMGAAWSTTLSYWVIWILRRRSVLGYVKVRFNLARDYTSYIVLLAQGILLLLIVDEGPVVYVSESAMLSAVALLYRDEIGMWFRLAHRAFGRFGTLLHRGGAS